MYEFIKYSKKNRYKNNCVMQNNTLQKEYLQIRIDKELMNDIDNLAKELDQTRSKVARDILIDFFLEQHTRNWQQEIKEWKTNL